MLISFEKFKNFFIEKEIPISTNMARAIFFGSTNMLKFFIYFLFDDVNLTKDAFHLLLMLFIHLIDEGLFLAQNQNPILFHFPNHLS